MDDDSTPRSLVQAVVPVEKYAGKKKRQARFFLSLVAVRHRMTQCGLESPIGDP